MQVDREKLDQARKLLQIISIRRLKEDVEKGLPPRVRQPPPPPPRPRPRPPGTRLSCWWTGSAAAVQWRYHGVVQIPPDAIFAQLLLTQRLLLDGPVILQVQKRVYCCVICRLSQMQTLPAPLLTKYLPLEPSKCAGRDQGALPAVSDVIPFTTANDQTLASRWLCTCAGGDQGVLSVVLGTIPDPKSMLPKRLPPDGLVFLQVQTRAWCPLSQMPTLLTLMLTNRVPQACAGGDQGVRPAASGVNCLKTAVDQVLASRWCCACAGGDQGVLPAVSDADLLVPPLAPEGLDAAEED